MVLSELTVGHLGGKVGSCNTKELWAKINNIIEISCSETQETDHINSKSHVAHVLRSDNFSGLGGESGSCGWLWTLGIVSILNKGNGIIKICAGQWPGFLEG